MQKIHTQGKPSIDTYEVSLAKLLYHTYADYASADLKIWIAAQLNRTDLQWRRISHIVCGCVGRPTMLITEKDLVRSIVQIGKIFSFSA